MSSIVKHTAVYTANNMYYIVERSCDPLDASLLEDSCCFKKTNHVPPLKLGKNWSWSCKVCKSEFPWVTKTDWNVFVPFGTNEEEMICYFREANEKRIKETIEKSRRCLKQNFK